MSTRKTTTGTQTGSTLLFSGVVLFCLVLVAWWVFFQVRETSRLEQIGKLIPTDRHAEALRILDADEDSDLQEVARRRRVMFGSESAVLGLLLLAGVVLLYSNVLRERRLRQQHERFLTGATHHLKTPLATVRLGIESLLAGSLKPDKQQYYLEAMLNDVDHLEKDLTNLLTAGDVHRRGPMLRRDIADLADDVRDAIDSMQNRCTAAGVSIKASDLQEARVSRDREAVHLILHNLLDNAVKYANRDDTIHVVLQRNGRDADLSIRDEGTGIAPSDLPLIFGRFYRGTEHNHLGGTGVGLHLVKELAEAHGGTVSVESKGAGQGACFRVRLPLAKEVGTS